MAVTQDRYGKPDRILIEAQRRAWWIQGPCVIAVDMYGRYISYKGRGVADEIFTHLDGPFSVSLTRDGQCLTFKDLQLVTFEALCFPGEVAEYSGKFFGSRSGAVTLTPVRDGGE